MLPCHNLWDLEEQRGRGIFKFIMRREGEKSQKTHFFQPEMAGFDHKILHKPENHS